MGKGIMKKCNRDRENVTCKRVAGLPACNLRTGVNQRLLAGAAKPVKTTPAIPLQQVSADMPPQVTDFPATIGTRPEALDSLSLYMREVGEVDLLTPEQEVKLAARIKRGDKAAREHMIRANLRLVVKIARSYEDYGLPLLDLINEGNVGLMRAVDKFDPAKGAKLSSYSSWWIKQSIRRAIANQGKTVRLPIHMMDKMAKVRRTVNRLTEELGQDPSDEEVGLELGLTARRVAKLRKINVGVTSLDAPVGSDDDASRLGDLIADERAENPYEELERKTLLAQLGDLLEELPEREREILRLRFGLDGGREWSLEEIGHDFGVTRERIRQLQNLALARLRKLIESEEILQEAA
jgi:RNA polymerase primary sigma factor